MNPPNDPMTKLVRSLPGQWFTLPEAARALGMSKKTLRSWIYKDVEGLQPGKKVQYGRTFLWVYSAEDLLRIKKNMERRVVVRDYEREPRKSIYTPEQKKRRSQLSAKRWYWKKMLDKARFYNDRDYFDKANQKLEEIEAAMDEIAREVTA